MAQVAFPIAWENAPRAPAACARATKSPARSPARAAGVVSMNTLFWKILVTRVKRKVRAFDRGAFPGGTRTAQSDAAIRWGRRRSGVATAIAAGIARRSATRGVGWANGCGGVAPGGVPPPRVYFTGRGLASPQYKFPRSGL